MMEKNLWFLWEIVVNTIEISLILYFFTRRLTLIKKSYLIRAGILLVCIVSICNYFNSYLTWEVTSDFFIPFSKIIIFASNLLVAIFCFSGSYTRRFMWGLIPIVVIFVADSLTLVVASILTDFSLNETLAFSEIRLPMTISYLIISAILYILIGNVNFRKKADKIYLPIYLRMFLIITLFIGLISVDQLSEVAFIMKSSGFDDSIFRVFILNIAFLTILAIVFIVFEKAASLFQSNIDYAIKVQRTSYENEQLKTYERSIKYLREAKHDMKEHLQVLQALFNNNETHELNKYFEKFNKKYSRDIEVVLSNNAILNALLTNKILHAQSLKIEFRYEIDSEIILPKDYMSICTIIGNLINNAIEACEKVKKNNPSINLSMKYANDMLLIAIENSSDGIYITENKTLHTTKTQEGHGIGIKHIQSIIEIMGGLIKIYPENDKFTVKVLIPMELQE